MRHLRERFPQLNFTHDDLADAAFHPEYDDFDPGDYEADELREQIEQHGPDFNLDEWLEQQMGEHKGRERGEGPFVTGDDSRSPPWTPPNDRGT